MCKLANLGAADGKCCNVCNHTCEYCRYPKCSVRIRADNWNHSNGHVHIEVASVAAVRPPIVWAQMDTAEKLRYIGRSDLAADYVRGGIVGERRVVAALLNMAYEHVCE